MKPRIPPPVIMLIALAAMWALERWLPLARLIAPPWNWLGAVPIVLGIAIAVAGSLHFRRAGTTISPLHPEKATHLVAGGPFRYSRNPMYLGMVLLLCGVALWLGSASPWLLPPLFALAITGLQIVPEERALARNFGDEYAAYRGQVARWLGRK